MVNMQLLTFVLQIYLEKVRSNMIITRSEWKCKLWFWTSSREFLPSYQVEFFISQALFVPFFTFFVRNREMGVPFFFFTTKKTKGRREKCCFFYPTKIPNVERKKELLMLLFATKTSTMLVQKKKKTFKISFLSFIS